MKKGRTNAKKPPTTSSKTTVAPTSREVEGFLALLGMTADEARAVGAEKFEAMVAEALEADRKRRYAAIEAQLEAASRLIEAGNTQAALGMLRLEMRGMSDEVVRQAAIARKFARMVYGSRSERLDPEELRQLCLAFGVSEEAYNDAVARGADVLVPAPEAPRIPEDADEPPAPATDPKKKRSSHKGRRPLELSSAVRVVETRIPVEGDEKVCALCGKDKPCIDVVRHERLEIVPPRLELHVELREVVGCTDCRADFVTAPSPDAERTRRRVGTSIAADLIAEKCNEAQPLHRQHARYGRLGWNAPITTVEDAYRWGTDLLAPIADVVRGEVLREDYVQADSTTLTVLDASHPSGRFKGQVWTFVSKNGVAFDFTSSWSAQDVAPCFAVNWNGYKQVDDYKGYGSVVEVEGIRRQLVPADRRLGCMMHARRRFHEALQAKDARAAEPLELIRRLYRVEQDGSALDDGARMLLREERARPVLERLRRWIEDRVDREPPKSLLGGAIHYAHQQWPYLERCYTRGDFAIDNGAPEREIRAIAIGRKNFLFTGSIAAAQRLVDAYTLVVQAKRLGLDPFVYLRDVLDQLERGFPVRRVAELTPRSIAAQKAAQ